MHIEWSATRFAATLGEIQHVTGLSQREIARIAGVNRSQVNRWTRGENQPGYDSIRRVAAAVQRRGHRTLGQQLMTSAGYAALPDGEDVSPVPDLIPEDDWERLVLEDETLPYAERADIVRRSRRLRAELYPALEPPSAQHAGREAAAPESHAG